MSLTHTNKNYTFSSISFALWNLKLERGTNLMVLKCNILVFLIMMTNGRPSPMSSLYWWAGDKKKTLALLAKNREGSSQCCGLALLLFMLKNLGYDEFENYTCTYSLGSLPQEIPVLDDRVFLSFMNFLLCTILEFGSCYDYQIIHWYTYFFSRFLRRVEETWSGVQLQKKNSLDPNLRPWESFEIGWNLFLIFEIFDAQFSY